MWDDSSSLEEWGPHLLSHSFLPTWCPSLFSPFFSLLGAPLDPQCGSWDWPGTSSSTLRMPTPGAVAGVPQRSPAFSPCQCVFLVPASCLESAHMYTTAVLNLNLPLHRKPKLTLLKTELPLPSLMLCSSLFASISNESHSLGHCSSQEPGS